MGEPGMKEIGRRLGGEIGHGSEKRVFHDVDHPRGVVGVFHDEVNYRGPEYAKAQFYLTKILHLLLPNNIPDMHLAATEPRVVALDKVVLSHAQEDFNEVR